MHPALPPNASDLWLVPSERDRAARTIATYEPLADGVKRYKDGDYAGGAGARHAPRARGHGAGGATPRTTRVSRQLRLGQVADARRTFDAVLDRKPPGLRRDRGGAGVGRGGGGGR